MNWIYEPWPWYVSGPMIAFIMFLLTILGKRFGMSANLRTLCTICGAGRKVDFFKFNWREKKWNLLMALGALIGGFIASNFMMPNAAVDINPDTILKLNELGFDSAGKEYLPNELFGNESVTSLKSFLLLAIGGLLIGFGTRYAGGCTSGHAIEGLSNLQIPSLIATIGFFVGGLTMVHFIYPLIF